MTFPFSLAIGRDWWLPEDLSVHGRQIDMLFMWIFWITMITFAAVWVTLIWFCIKYRAQPDKKKATFTHGNTRLEMVWTLLPAVILIVLALVTKRVWDDYRYSPTKNDPNVARVLVIGQQFKWNIIYPGPDGKLGRYLMYPKPTDLKWPQDPPGTEESEKWNWPAGVPGPAFMPEEKAKQELIKYVEARNPMGKDFYDADGADDDWKGSIRDLVIPKGRPIEVHIGSRDVIHDFFLPNYRVKLDAVPGLRGKLYFTATKSSAELEKQGRRKYSLDELTKLVAVKNAPEYRLVIPEDDARSEWKGTPGDADSYRRYWKEVTKTKKVKGKVQEVKEHETVATEGTPISQQMIDDLRANGFNEVSAFTPVYWDLVCEELCGPSHYTMRGRVVVLEPEEYKRRFETPLTAPVAAGAGAATTRPAVATAR